MLKKENFRIFPEVLLFAFIFVFITAPSSLISQSNISGPEIKSSQSSLRSDEPAIDQAVNTQTETDEYGELGYNGYLAGLNGLSNFVQVASQTAFSQNFDGSIEMWIYPQSVTGTRQFIGKGSSSNVQFIWGLAGNLQYFRIGTTSVTNTGGITIPVNQWSHVAVTWTGGNPFTINFYVNGAQSGSSSVLNNAWAANIDPMKIGGPSGGFNAEVFNGYIDEVRFWDTQRTAIQIRNNRFAGIGDGANTNSSSALVSAVEYTGLISSWNFNKSGTAPDYINNYNGVYAGTAYSQQTLASSPIPYNFVLRCPGTGGTSRVNVPHNSLFNQYGDGTMEAWVYTFVNNQTKEIVAKGNTASVSFVFGMASNGKLYARFGNMASINNDGITIPINQWVHVAWVWSTVSGAFNIRYYVNGQLSGTPLNNTGVFNQNSDPLTIGGGIAFPSEGWNGFIDEVRFWSDQKTQDRIKSIMFGSARGLSITGLVGAWNFDGNLLNRNTAVTGIDGTFNTGGTNDCRFSAFVNETSTGAPGVGFTSHTTVVNRAGAGNPFPGGFGLRAPFKPLPDLQTVRDTITFTGAGNVTSVEVFMSIRHTWISDLNITLRAPNGQTRDLSSGNGGSGDNLLTFFIDGSTSITSSGFLAPWSNICAPEQTLGTFGSSPTAGAWIIEIADLFSGDVGNLQGWGIRLNNSITANENLSGNIPARFNLYQNYPNPFNPETNIRFDLPKGSSVKIAIYDMLGQEVSVILNEFKPAGEYDIKFNGSNLSSGVYFYRIDAGDFTDVKKLTLVK